MNEKVIWDFLYNKTNNAKGTAALMGNLFAESSLNPRCANGVKKKYGWTNDEYITHCKNGSHDFVNDSVAFGLAQWCFNKRKQGLWDMSKSNFDDINVQLNYLWQELPGYKTVYNAVVNGTNLREISDIVLLKYEKPASTSEKVKQLRASYGQKYYDEFAPKSKDAIPVSRSQLASWQQILKDSL